MVGMSRGGGIRGTAGSGKGRKRIHAITAKGALTHAAPEKGRGWQEMKGKKAVNGGGTTITRKIRRKDEMGYELQSKKWRGINKG